MIPFNHRFVRVSFRREDFRLSLAKPCAATCGGAFLLVETLMIWPIEQSDFTLAVFAFAGVLVICAAVLLMVSSLIHWEVGPDGMQFHGLWPRPRHVSWNDVGRARLQRFCGLEYLIVQAAHARRSLWVPMIVNRPELFINMVQTYAPTRVDNLDDSEKRLVA